ncbi:MAG: formate dehydrogenase accessory sulfurtransferase FdhD [Candidatus Hydrothermia bacterium]
MIEKRKVLRFQQGEISGLEDFISREELYEIYINGELFSRNTLSPEYIREWALGYLFTSGVLKGTEEVEVEVEGEKIFVKSGNINPGELYTYLPSGCGMGKENLCLGGLKPIEIREDFKVAPDSLFSLFEKFNSLSVNFKLSGSLHSAALSDGKDISFFAEDVGRHNAVDKVIGMALNNNFDFRKSLILTTGRISVEIVKKCITCGVPLLVSHSAPTTFAMDLANAYKITLIGFLRGRRFNIYTNFLFNF